MTKKVICRRYTSDLVLICGRSQADLHGTLDYGSWSKVGFWSRLPEPVPRPIRVAPSLRKQAALNGIFLVAIIFPVAAYRRFIWVSVQASMFLVLLHTSERLGIFFLLVVQDPILRARHLSAPPNEPLRRFLQQDVLPTLAHPATRSHLLGTNAIRCASVDSHGSNDLHCCISSSCSTCPTILGAHTTNFESRRYIVRAGSRLWPTYLQYRSHAHTAGLLLTALPTTAQHD